MIYNYKIIKTKLKKTNVIIYCIYLIDFIYLFLSLMIKSFVKKQIFD